MLTIDTARAVLRDYENTASELESLCRFLGDPDVATHSSWGPLTRGETADFLAGAELASRAQPRRNYALALRLKTDGDLIGNITLNIRNPQTREAEVGYTLRRDHWGQGYASEAAKAIVLFGFATLGLHRIYATTSPLNVASQRVLERLGFTYEGHLRKNVLQRGQWRDSFLYAVVAGDNP